MVEPDWVDVVELDSVDVVERKEMGLEPGDVWERGQTVLGSGMDVADGGRSRRKDGMSMVLHVVAHEASHRTHDL